MQTLIRSYQALLASLPPHQPRDLSQQINWSAPLILLCGAKGTGKTTLLLQHLSSQMPQNNQVLYLSLTWPIFYKTTLLDLAEDFYLSGGRYLVLDDLHQYANWPRELPQIRKTCPKLQIVAAIFTIMPDQQLPTDALVYRLPGLSFREYLRHKHQINLPKALLSSLIHPPAYPTPWPANFDPQPYWQTYLRQGYHPIGLQQTENQHYAWLYATTHQALGFDLAQAMNLSQHMIRKTRHLLGILTADLPYIPNITKLTERLQTSREKIYRTLQSLSQAQLIVLMRHPGGSQALMAKPESIYPGNPNQLFAAQLQPDPRTVAQTLLINQLRQAGHPPGIPKAHHLMVDQQYVLRTDHPNLDTEAQTLVHIDLANGEQKAQIPLWYFGMLY